MKKLLLIVFIILCVKHTNAQDDIRNIDVGYNNDNKIHFTYEGRKIRLRGVPRSVKRGYEYWWKYNGEWYQGEYYETGNITSDYDFSYYKNFIQREDYSVRISFNTILTEKFDVCKGDSKKLEINNANGIGNVRAYEWYEWANNSWVHRSNNSTYTANIPIDADPEKNKVDGTVRIFRGLAIYDGGSVEKVFNITPRALIATRQVKSNH